MPSRFGAECTNYSSKDAFRNSVLAGTAGIVGGVIGSGMVGAVGLNLAYENACRKWSDHYSDWLYPLGYYEGVKNIVMKNLRDSGKYSIDELREYEKALYSVPDYAFTGASIMGDKFPWGPYKQVNPSGQICNDKRYNLKHNLIEIHEGNGGKDSGKYMKNLSNFISLNNVVQRILKGDDINPPRNFKINTRFGAGGSILPYSGTDGVGGAYAQPSFGFGEKHSVVKRKRKVTKRKRKVDKKKIKQKLVLKSIKKSTRKDKKYMATFIMPNGRSKTTHFGAAGMSDFTKHKDTERKQRYITRHKKRENWNDPTTAGALSLYILWNKPTLKASIIDYKKRFKFN